MRPVLVVEDDRKIARVVALYLEEAGYRVVVAEDGRGARSTDAAAKEEPLLVILDLMLPTWAASRSSRSSRRSATSP